MSHVGNFHKSHDGQNKNETRFERIKTKMKQKKLCGPKWNDPKSCTKNIFKPSKNNPQTI